MQPSHSQVEQVVSAVRDEADIGVGGQLLSNYLGCLQSLDLDLGRSELLDGVVDQSCRLGLGLRPNDLGQLQLLVASHN